MSMVPTQEQELKYARREAKMLRDRVEELEAELQATREVLQFADGGFVAQLGMGIADLYAEDADAQTVLHDAGCWPRGSDHTTPTAGVGHP